MKNKIILLSAISFFLFSCGNASDEKQTGQKDTLITTEEHHHDEESKAIELNNGEKWKVDDQMMVHLRNMETDVSAFDKSGQKEYKVLAGKLEANIDLLTSNCTMKGKAHDELHKWLLPYIDLAKEFSDAKDNAEAAEIFVRIKISFDEFNKYFQ